MTDAAELEQWISRARAAGVYAFDVETDGMDEMSAVPLGFSLSSEEGRACYIPIRARDVQCIPDEVKRRLAGLLEDPKVRLVGQNVKYDYKVLRRWGVTPANVFFDTMIAAWVLESDDGAYSLDRMAEKRLGYRTMPYGELVGKDQTLEDIPIQQVTDYSGEDADLTLRMHRLLSAELEAQGLDAVLATGRDAPPRGARRDGAHRHPHPVHRAAAYGRELERDLARLEQEIYQLCGRKFNINSTKQLQEILFTWRKLTPVRKTKTGFSTDVDVLEILAAQDPVPEKILRTASSPS